MQKLFLPVHFIALLLLTALGLSACEDEISTIGAPYFNDTIGITTDTFDLSASTPGITVSSYSLPVIPTPTLTYNATAGSGTLFFGKAEAGAIEAWSVLKFPVLQPDTLQKVTSVKLILKVIPYRHGDQTTLAEDVKVYVEGAGKINESTTALTLADLSPNPFGQFVGDQKDTTGLSIEIALDSAIRTQLSAASTSLVLVPGAMSNIRAVGSVDVADKQFQPQLEFTYLDGATEKKTYRKPALDLNIIKRTNALTPDQLLIAGGTNDRILFTVKVDSLHVDRFASINTATLRMKLDPANSSIGQNLRDTTGPAVIFKNTASPSDTSVSLIAFGTKSKSDPNIYEFQLRDVIEQWLDEPARNFGFELRAGYAPRTVGGSIIITEDYTLNRWTFFGPNSAAADRPMLIITSSSLK
jgi:hypothetical protein